MVHPTGGKGEWVILAPARGNNVMCGLYCSRGVTVFLQPNVAGSVGACFVLLWWAEFSYTSIKLMRVSATAYSGF